MKETKHQFPAEEVTLPSKGILYPEDSPLRSGIIEMKYMTAKEEDILTNQNLIANGTVLDKLLQSLILTKFDYNNLLVGDKNAIMVAARILGYGADYEFEYRGEKCNINLAELEDKPLSAKPIEEGKNEFSFTLPKAKKEITFKILTHKDESDISREIKGLMKLNKNANPDLTTRMKYIIQSVDGDYEKKTVRNFVDNEFLALDAREFRQYVRKIQPDVDLTFNYEDQRGNIKEIDIPVGIQFFWPDASV